MVSQSEGLLRQAKSWKAGCHELKRFAAVQRVRLPPRKGAARQPERRYRRGATGRSGSWPAGESRDGLPGNLACGQGSRTGIASMKSRPRPSCACAAALHPQGVRHEASSGHTDTGRQGGATGNPDAAGAGLRGGFSAVLVRLPARAVGSRCPEPISQGHRRAGPTVGDRRGSQIVLRRDPARPRTPTGVTGWRRSRPSTFSASPTSGGTHLPGPETPSSALSVSPIRPWT